MKPEKVTLGEHEFTDNSPEQKFYEEARRALFKLEQKYRLEAGTFVSLIASIAGGFTGVLMSAVIGLDSESTAAIKNGVHTIIDAAIEKAIKDMKPPMN